MRSGRANSRRDLAAGALMALIGSGAVITAYGYDIGSLRSVGPGFLPMVLGCVLIGVGVAIAMGFGGGADDAAGADVLQADSPLDWRGGSAIVIGVAAFVVLGAYAGLLPAVFACVFISAIGDRTTTWRGAALLATLVAVIGSVVFVYALKIPFPLVRW